MNQNQATTSAGDVAGNARAAAAVATAAREQAKKEWYNSVWLHVTFAVTLIATAIIIAKTYDLNLFWGLVLGSGLIWIASKSTKQSHPIVKRWSLVLRVVGWVVLATALVPSGLRYFAEFAVEGTNSTLCRWSGKACGGGDNTSTTKPFGPSGDEPSGETVTFILGLNGVETKVVGINSPIKLAIPRSPRSEDGMTLSAGCARIVSPPVLAAIKGKPVKRLSSDYRTSFDMMLADPVRQVMLENGINRVTLEFRHRVYDSKSEEECPGY